MARIGYSRAVLRRLLVLGAFCALLPALLAGCGADKPGDELLLVYSGDCQAYIEPCG